MRGESKQRQREAWGSAIGYHRLSANLMPAINRLIDWLEIGPDDRVLDIATGTGRAAIVARSTGASVIGQDISPNLLSEGTHYAIEQGYHDITFDESDFDELPYPNSSFTAVISTFGVVHSRRGSAVADEIDRVLAGNGKLGLATWQQNSRIFDLLRILAGYGEDTLTGTEIGPWSRPEEIRGFLIRRHIPRLEFETGELTFQYPDPASAWNDWKTNYGPFRAFYTSLSAQRKAMLDQEATEFFARSAAGDGGIEWRLGYLLTRGRKLPSTSRLG